MGRVGVNADGRLAFAQDGRLFFSDGGGCCCEGGLTCAPVYRVDCASPDWARCCHLGMDYLLAIQSTLTFEAVQTAPGIVNQRIGGQTVSRFPPPPGGIVERLTITVDGSATFRGSDGGNYTLVPADTQGSVTIDARTWSPVPEPGEYTTQQETRPFFGLARAFGFPEQVASEAARRGPLNLLQLLQASGILNSLPVPVFESMVRASPLLVGERDEQGAQIGRHPQIRCLSSRATVVGAGGRPGGYPFNYWHATFVDGQPVTCLLYTSDAADRRG